MVEGAFEEISAQNSEDKYKEKTHHKHIDHWRDWWDQRIYDQFKTLIAGYDSKRSESTDGTQCLECFKSGGRNASNSEGEVNKRGNHNYEVENVPTIAHIRFAVDRTADEASCDYFENCFQEEEKSENAVNYEQHSAEFAVWIIEWIINCNGDATGDDE